MLLFREIYGWLRYLVAKDPMCNAQGIVVEEICSTFAPLGDTNDGVRTLAIHRVQDGMTPRLEFRAIGLHPQVYWYDADASDGTLVSVTNQFGFIGDYKSWDCSDTCNGLLNLIREKFCSNNDKDDAVTAADLPTGTNFTLIELPIVERVLKSVMDASQKPKGGDPLTSSKVNKWLKDNVQGADLHDFAMSVIHWFDKGKVIWKQIDYLEDEYHPGRDIIPWDWIKRQFKLERDRLGKLPPNIVDRVLAETESSMCAARVKKHFDTIVREFAKGRKLPSILCDQVNFGRAAIAQFKAGAIPFQYLQQLEICDPHESILPWSFIKRSVLSYTSKKVQAAVDGESLVEAILKWLKDSHLLLLLYKGDPAQEDALAKALKAQLEHHIGQTLKNELWMKAILNALSSDTVTEMKRSLQVEFDLWLLDALSPAVNQYKLPLSPHSFSIEKKDQEMYNKMYNIWESIVKDYLKSYREESGKRLTDAIANFYAQLTSLWKGDELKEYKAKIPSASKILNAVEEGKVLCEDLEHEVGNGIPDDIRTRLLSSPYFNAISREVKLQGMLA
jgi:hypothetical protein